MKATKGSAFNDEGRSVPPQRSRGHNQRACEVGVFLENTGHEE